MARSTFTVDQRLAAMQLALDALDADDAMQASLADVGYDAPRLAHGRQLYDAAANLHLHQQAEYGQQYAATDALDAAWEAADAEYARLVKIARVALKSQPGHWTTLDLVGPRKASLSGWLLQARQFYQNALAQPTILAALATYGISAGRLQAGQNLVAAVEAANVDQKRERGEAQEATLKRDNALDAMDDWYSDFIAIARVVLDDTPQQLEKLGLVTA
jgi:hypothetical protein